MKRGEGMDRLLGVLYFPIVEGQLELRIDLESPRHYLNGEPVQCGEALELRVPGPSWIRGRYEWTGNLKDEPRFFFEIAPGVPDASIPLPKTATVRRLKR